MGREHGNLSTVLRKVNELRYAMSPVAQGSHTSFPATMPQCALYSRNSESTARSHPPGIDKSAEPTASRLSTPTEQFTIARHVR